MKKEMLNLKLFFSLIFGVVGIIFLVFNFLYLYIPPVAYPHTILQKITTSYHYLIRESSVFIGTILLFLAQFSFLISFFLSLLGIFLGFQSFKASRQKLAIFAIILNFINFFFSIFIAWLVYGITHYM